MALRTFTLLAHGPVLGIRSDTFELIIINKPLIFDYEFKYHCACKAGT